MEDGWGDDDAGPETGSANVVWAPSSAGAMYLAKLTIEGAAAGDRAGDNVAISGDLIAVTAPGRVLERESGGSVTGAVVLFHRNGAAW